MLASRIGSFEDLRVADLFAGSGALGFEALSRGARSALFVENDPRAVAVIRSNAQKLGASEQIEILNGSALALPGRDPCDLIFADPPYAAGAGTAVVASIDRAGWLARGGWLGLETSRDDEPDPGSLEIVIARQVGRARLTLMRRP